MIMIYRNTYKLFACNGIMYNHESPRRGENFVTRKICRAAARIKLGLESELLLGDTTAQRDWGHARDYVQAMWLVLQHQAPDDFVFATGKTHSVQDVVETAFAAVQLNWRDHVKQDARFIRPVEPMRLVGNASKARQALNWEPRTTFAELITEMTLSELDAASPRSRA
jgi:GDPmannose 4,6-dehydratase